MNAALPIPRHATLECAPASAVADAFRRLGAMLDDLSPMQAALVQAILRRPGITTSQICDALWQNDPNGGPDAAPQSVAQRAYHARKRMAPHGYTVRSAGRRWYIERIEE